MPTKEILYQKDNYLLEKMAASMIGGFTNCEDGLHAISGVLLLIYFK